MIPKRVLCICQKGNMRSVACAYLLKKKYKIDALACGMRTSHRDTVLMLCNWAELVIVLRAHYKDELPTEVQKKTIVIDVGTDRWFKGYPEDLLYKLDGVLIAYFSTLDDKTI